MKKILILASTFPRFKDDKLPKFIFNYAKLLTNEFEIHVLAPYDKGSKLFEIMDGIKVHRYKYFPGGGGIAYKGGIMNNLKSNRLLFLQLPFFIFFQFIAVVRLCKKEKIGLINAHWVLPQGLIAVLYKKIFNRKINVFCTSHGSDILGLRGKVNMFLKKYVLKNCDLLTVVSNYMREKVMEMNLNIDVRVAPMSVDVDLFSRTEDNLIRKEMSIDSDFLLFVGRLNEKKGIRYVLRAMPDILKFSPDAKLVVIGEGPLEFELKDECKTLDILSSVFFLGALGQNDLPKYYSGADVFLGVSIDFEGLGLVNAEAMSCGCIVIASDLPSISDVVVDSVTGFVVSQRDEKSIVEKVIYVLKNKNNLEGVRKLGREHVKKHFSKEAVSENYKSIIKELFSR